MGPLEVLILVLLIAIPVGAIFMVVRVIGRRLDR
jgi:hypothetical protein